MKPPRSILDKSYPWVPAANTDITKRWRAMGWRPPSEHRAKVLPIFTKGTVKT